MPTLKGGGLKCVIVFEGEDVYGNGDDFVSQADHDAFSAFNVQVRGFHEVQFAGAQHLKDAKAAAAKAAAAEAEAAEAKATTATAPDTTAANSAGDAEAAAETANTGSNASKTAPASKAAQLEDVAYIMYTSGTTGTPKGCVNACDNVASIANAI